MITAADLIGMKEKGAVEGRMVDASSIRHGYVEEKHPSSGFWARIIKKIELQPTAEQLANPAGRWSNPDLDPVLPKDRTWRSYNCESDCNPFIGNGGVGAGPNPLGYWIQAQESP